MSTMPTPHYIPNRPLIEVNPQDSIDKQCQDIVSNWEIVCEENDYHKDYVTPSQWAQWETKRNSVNNRLVELSTAPLGEIHDYLTSLQYSIEQANRVDMHQKWLKEREQERKAIVENEVRKQREEAQREAERKKQEIERIERESQPSTSLLDKLLFWR